MSISVKLDKHQKRLLYNVLFSLLIGVVMFLLEPIFVGVTPTAWCTPDLILGKPSSAFLDQPPERVLQQVQRKIPELLKDPDGPVILRRLERHHQQVDNRERILWTLLGVLTTFIIIEIGSYIKHRNVYQDSLDLIEGLQGGVPGPLQDYVRVQLDLNVTDIQTDIRLLQSKGCEQGFADKIDIVSSLLPIAKTRYLATTLDLPSMMESQCKRFFDDQEKLLSCTDKRRLVVISENDMQQEIVDSNKRRSLKWFVEWHSRNLFSLRFLVDSRDEFLRRARQEIRRIRSTGDNDVVADFAIFDDKWVFGEVGDYDNAESQRRLLIREARPIGDPVVEYGKFYESIWANLRGGKWPLLSARQVYSECKRLDKKEAEAGFLAREYPSYQKKTGAVFLAEVCNSISAAKSIKAMDIACMKSGFDGWICRPEYQGFMQATITSAKGGGDCSRIYVLKQQTYDRYSCEQFYDAVLWPQLAEGITVYLADFADLTDKDLSAHDFIIADELCFGLGWNEDFAEADLAPEKNLEPKSVKEWYEEMWGDIMKKQCVYKTDKNRDRAEVIRYLENLG